MIAFIGCGNMAEALIAGMRRFGLKDEIIASEPNQPRRTKIGKFYNVETTPDNKEAVQRADVVIIAVKPQHIDEVIEDIKCSVTPDKIIVSIVAGITIGFYLDRLDTERIVRVMPNVGAFKGESMNVMCFNDCMNDAEKERVGGVFKASGRAKHIPEQHMDAATALSGSGPAFTALFIFEMIEAGRGLGLPQHTALILAVQTLAGTASMLNDVAPEEFIDLVCSAGGVTDEGLKALESGGLGDIVRDALMAAANKSKQLTREA